MKHWLVVAALWLMPHVACAQGAILENLADFQGTPRPPGLRGTIPARVDLASKLPVPRSQGSTSTCTSWSATYAAASFAVRARGYGSAMILSPSFTYNQVSRDQWCRVGTSISSTLDLLRDVGALPIEEFAFDGGWCGRRPTPTELDRAKQFRIKGWMVLDATIVHNVKAQLARGVPVIFAIRGTAKMRALQGDAVLEDDDTPGESHAMVAVGYDDAKRAFLIQNSYGQSWGAKGYGWFSYEFWKRNVSVGFVIE